MVILPLDFAPAVDHDNGVQARPLVARLQPVDIVDDRVVPGLDAAVIAIDGLVVVTVASLNSLAFCSVDEEFDILPQGSLIALQRHNVVGLLLHDFRAMSRWQPMASIVTIAPSMDIMSSSAGIEGRSLSRPAFSFPPLHLPALERLRRQEPEETLFSDRVK